MALDILLNKFCRPTIFWVWNKIFKLLSFFFSSKSCDSWYQSLTWQDVQGYLVKNYFLVKQCNPEGGAESAPPVWFLPSNMPYGIGLKHTKTDRNWQWQRYKHIKFMRLIIVQALPTPASAARSNNKINLFSLSLFLSLSLSLSLSPPYQLSIYSKSHISQLKTDILT